MYTQQKKPASNATSVFLSSINNLDTAKSIPQMEREEEASRAAMKKARPAPPGQA